MSVALPRGPSGPAGLSGPSGLRDERVSRLTASLSIGQGTRLIQIDTSLPPGTLVVERFTLTEAVHADEPLCAAVDCLSTNAHLALKALMGEQLTTIDAVAYSFLANVIYLPFETELKRAALGFPTLVTYCEAMEQGLQLDG